MLAMRILETIGIRRPPTAQLRDSIFIPPTLAEKPSSRISHCNRRCFPQE
jgi:hypothetical protein